MLIESGIGVIFLAAAQLWVNKLNLTHIPRSKWLSLGGGISVGYVFIHILPELYEWQELIAENQTIRQIEFLKNHIYIFALLGLTFFYGLERAAKLSKAGKRKADNEGAQENKNIFWIHISSFSIYNFLIGYLLINRKTENLHDLILFVIAMAFHFVVNDYGLWDHYRHIYHKKGRWIISLSVVTGWLFGIFIEIKEEYLGFIFAFIAGGIIMNVLKEEVPEERKSNYKAFLLGVVLYTVLLLGI